MLNDMVRGKAITATILNAAIPGGLLLLRKPAGGDG